MEVIQGKSIFGGIAIGPIYFFTKDVYKRQVSGIPGSGSLRKICRVFLKRDIPDTTDAPIKKQAVSVSIFAGGSAHSSDIGSGRNLRPALEL